MSNIVCNGANPVVDLDEDNLCSIASDNDEEDDVFSAVQVKVKIV